MLNKFLENQTSYAFFTFSSSVIIIPNKILKVKIVMKTATLFCEEKSSKYALLCDYMSCKFLVHFEFLCMAWDSTPVWFFCM